MALFGITDGEGQNEFAERVKIENVKGKNVFDVPELFYFLQPIYNDGLHLGGKEDVKRKIKSCYLKTDNLYVRRMIQMMFS